MIEDSEIDATLITSILEQSGFFMETERVDTREAMKNALKEKSWDVVIK